MRPPGWIYWASWLVVSAIVSVAAAALVDGLALFGPKSCWALAKPGRVLVGVLRMDTVPPEAGVVNVVIMNQIAYTGLFFVSLALVGFFRRNRRQRPLL